MRKVLRVGVVGAATALLVGCTDGQGGAPVAADDDTAMGHVHGLGVDAATGDVLAATHFGLFRLADGEAPKRVADRWQDTMAFTVDGDRLLGSGHPDLREDLPVHLGLIESTDGGETWDVLSLQGESDLHALVVVDSQVSAWDSIAGRIITSSDGGVTWTSGAAVDAVSDLALLQDGSLLATTPEGLLRSADGTTLEAFEPAPPRPLTQIEVPSDDTGDLVGLSTEGTLWSLSSGAWSELGALGAPPTAFAAAEDGTLVAATEQQVLRSSDDGLTWGDVSGP